LSILYNQYTGVDCTPAIVMGQWEISLRHTQCWSVFCYIALYYTLHCTLFYSSMAVTQASPGEIVVDV